VVGVILIRLLWVFLSGKIARLFPLRLRSMPDAPQGELLVVGWTGLRGVVSMAAALALPHQTDSGFPFPYRNLILLVTFSGDSRDVAAAGTDTAVSHLSRTIAGRSK
jgi:CPA1 family monovalent cation:H+ antiporter